MIFKRSMFCIKCTNLYQYESGVKMIAENSEIDKKITNNYRTIININVI